MYLHNNRQKLRSRLRGHFDIEDEAVFTLSRTSGRLALPSWIALNAEGSVRAGDQRHLHGRVVVAGFDVDWWLPSQLSHGCCGVLDTKEGVDPVNGQLRTWFAGRVD